jgi:hypothetical protein
MAKRKNNRRLNAVKQVIDGLSVMEDAFCVAFTSIGTDTCDNGTKAAAAAGYSQPHNAAWRLLKRDEIRQRIHEIHTRMMDKYLITPQGVLTKLEHLRIRAESKGDLATCAKCVELEGKYLSMFSDRLHVDIHTDNPLELSAAVRPAALEEAQRQLMAGGVDLPVLDAQPQPAVIDADFESDRRQRIIETEQARQMLFDSQEENDEQTD